MTANVIFSTIMVGLGPAIQALGRWGSTRLADHCTESDIYTNRVKMRIKYSSDRVQRTYYGTFGCDMPFEVRSLPIWMELDAKQAQHYAQYKNHDWKSPIPLTTEYALQNKEWKDKCREYDAQWAHDHLFPQQHAQWKKEQYDFLDKQIKELDVQIEAKKQQQQQGL